MGKLLLGKTAIVTGANRGIGNAVVRNFAVNGANVIACARKEDELFEKQMKILANENGVNVYCKYFDMTDESLMKDIIKNIRKETSNIDILVNVAGIFHSKLFQMTKEEELRNIFEVNFFAPVLFTQRVLRLMKSKKGGAIVNVTSIAGIDPRPTNSVYGSSKAALAMFTKILASELASQSIRVNAVAPGNTNTGMISELIASVGEETVAGISAMKRLATVEEIANTITFLVSDKASFINGQVIKIDGGST